MKTVFGTILTLVFLVGVAYSLNCYLCDKQSSNMNCMSAMTPCASSATFCKTEVNTANGKSITKTCEAACTPIDTATQKITCCNTDGCNTSGASGVKGSAMVLSVAVGASVLLMLRAGL